MKFFAKQTPSKAAGDAEMKNEQEDERPSSVAADHYEFV